MMTFSNGSTSFGRKQHGRLTFSPTLCLVASAMTLSFGPFGRHAESVDRMVSRPYGFRPSGVEPFKLEVRAEKKTS
jgi:hypothetical protein